MGYIAIDGIYSNIGFRFTFTVNCPEVYSLETFELLLRLMPRKSFWVKNTLVVVSVLDDFNHFML